MKPVLALALCFAAFAQTQSDQSRSRGTIGTAVSDPVVDFYDSISDYFRQSRNAVALIHKKGIPDEEIAAVLTIARKSSASPNQVIDARKKGKSWEEIAKEHRVNLPGDKFVSAANVQFLSEYHGRKPAEVLEMVTKGASFIQINQEFRRQGGSSAPPKP